MKISFFTPASSLPNDSFGGATFGFIGQENPLVPASVSLPWDIQGILVNGTYQRCLEAIPDVPYQACIVMLGNAGDENAFIRQLSAKVNAPLVGGGAAIHPETGASGLITGNTQAALYYITDPRYEVEICCKNIHEDILGEHCMGFDDARILRTIDGVNAAAWLERKKESLNLSADDFEHLTFSDRNGINAHLSNNNGIIHSGRDLQPKMQLRYVPKELVFHRMYDFYNDRDAVTFGCAGLKGILPKELHSQGVGLFLFGEVCTKDGKSEFGNLMLSKLRIVKK